MRSAPVARAISTRTSVAHMAPKTVPKRLFSVGGYFTLERSRRAYLPPPLRTASASISALHVCPAMGKVARDHPQREKACAMAPVTSLRAWALAAACVPTCAPFEAKVAVLIAGTQRGFFATASWVDWFMVRELPEVTSAS